MSYEEKNPHHEESHREERPQPERPQPRGRGRRIAVWSAVAVLALLVAVDPFHLHPGDDWVLHQLGFHGEEAPGGSGLWTCGMHPEVILEEPGQCPICHMDLVPLETGEETSGEEAMAHDHGSMVEGMGQEAGLYTCPMHPQILEEEPGTCPICGMNLVPVEGEAGMEGAGMEGRGMQAAGAQGVTVTIDPTVVQNMNVRTEVVQRRDITREIRTVGYLDYDQGKMVTVTTKYPGFIERSYVNYIGEPVRRGQPLFTIYSPELVQTQQELLSALDYARRMEQAPEEARRRAQALVEAARTRLSYWDITEAQVAQVEETGQVLRALTVTAPSSGLVMKRMPGLEGMRAQPGMELLHIADLSSLWLGVEVFEDQLPWLREGSEAKVALSYFPGEVFQGRVRFVEPQVSETTRTVGLRLEVPNPEGRLRAGMYATVVFEPVAAEDAVTVPSMAVLRTGERNLVVLALGDGRFAPREVELGLEGEGTVQVLSGLEAGERVVTSAQFLLDSESNLREAIQKLIAAKRGEAGAADAAAAAAGHAGHGGH